MSIPKAALDIIKQSEGLRLTAYLCPAGIPTIGYGHTKSVTRAHVAGKRTIYEAEADRLLREDVARFEAAVDRLVTTPLTPNERGALVSFTYNLGEGALAGSTLLKKINAHDMAGAAKEFAKWNKATVGGKKTVLKGLVTRREAERVLFEAK